MRPNPATFGAAAVCAALLLTGGEAAARPSCAGKRATIVGGPKGEKLRGTRDRDVIVAGAGDDRIIGLLARDTICAGPGDDAVIGGLNKDKAYGEGGDDRIDGGEGKETVYGGSGADILIGDSGADRLHGGGGPDRVLGGIQDDRLWGDSGRDAVIGDHGVDTLNGNGGDDWLRGDVNADVHDGGPGDDTISFATATPGGPNFPTGVEVNLRRGRADGDDEGDVLRGIENVVGSPFDDTIVGIGIGFVLGGFGEDGCSAFDLVRCLGIEPAEATAYIADPNSPDPGVVLYGDDGPDNWTIRGGSGSVRITGSGARPGDGCERAGAGISCAIAPRRLGYILAWGDSGADRVQIGRGIPNTTMVKVDGGYGDDRLEGGKESDLLFAGEGGNDVLLGRGGDDALAGRPGGGDSLLGGRGNDNLVSDSPCQGHVYDGGRGITDVAGFGHVNSGGVEAALGGTARLRGASSCSATVLRGNSEVLEGTRFDDVLRAQGPGDLLLGRQGADRCIGGIHRGC